MPQTNQKIITKLSKFLSLVLRHKPEEIGIKLSKSGWTDTSTLIENMNEAGKLIDLETLRLIVDTNTKKRFSFNEDHSQIRANQGHSVELDLGYRPKTPPKFLYHGTAQKNIISIFKSGIQKRERHHVHLSADIDTALRVGQRHGKPVLLKVMTGNMHENGHLFFMSDNGVWLTEEVPVKYFTTEETEE